MWLMAQLNSALARAQGLMPRVDMEIQELWGERAAGTNGKARPDVITRADTVKRAYLF